jgi:hypothetical protein
MFLEKHLACPVLTIRIYQVDRIGFTPGTKCYFEPDALFIATSKIVYPQANAGFNYKNINCKGKIMIWLCFRRG